MKQSAEVIKKWVDIISDDYMHYTDEQKKYVCKLASVIDFEIIDNDIGVIGWATMRDFDCKIKTNVLILYCKPEYRGNKFIPMLRRLENIARSEGAEKIIIGNSISGYKSKIFDLIIKRNGYSNNGYLKGL